MSNLTLYQGDFRDRLSDVVSTHGPYKMLFADPPDNINWGYTGYQDSLEYEEYENLLYETFTEGMGHAEILWVSFNTNHLSLVGSLLYDLVTHARKNWEVRYFMQYTTFGMNMKADFSRCFRPLVRLMRPGVETYPDAVRIESERQRIGDKRADPRGKIPPDVWAIHRVTGNSKQRRRWHPTQLNEALYERCLGFSATRGDRVGDLFAGTGTIARAAAGRGLNVDMFEISPEYCKRLSEEFEIPIN